MAPRLSAIVVTRDSGREIVACLRSLAASTVPLDEIVVVDQASRDGTPDLVRRLCPEALVLEYWDNPGFGEGNNRALRTAVGDYCLLLNPDAAVTPDCVGRLVETLEEQQDAAVAVPKTVLASEPTILNSAGLQMNQVGYAWDRGFLEWDRRQHDRAEPVLAGSGCALLLRAAPIRQLGGFDPSYFLYYEDLDLCHRAWLAGHPVHYEPAAVVRHAMTLHGRPRMYREYLDHRNRLRTVLKGWPARLLWPRLPRLFAFEAASALGLVRRGQGRALAWRARAWGSVLARLFSTLRARRRLQRARAIEPSRLEAFLADGHGAPVVAAAVPDYPPALGEGPPPATLALQIEPGVGLPAGLGLGWHAAERLDGQSARWSCGYGVLFLRVPEPGRRAVLTLHWRAARPVSVTVRAGGQDLGAHTVAPGSWQTTRIPLTAPGPALRVELHPHACVVPVRDLPPSGDRRTLGVALRAAMLEPPHML